MELMEKKLLATIGLADSCELLAVAFAFPTRELAAALSDGAFQADCASCLKDAGADWADPGAKLSSLVGSDAEELFDELRKGHSLLYLALGKGTAIWPYEAPFLSSVAGCEGGASLFRSGCQIDVERHMREAGVLPKDARTEPSDSAWNELSFMSYLYGNVAKALNEGREEDGAAWSGRIARFWGEHAGEWLPAFMERTIEEALRLSHGSEYAAFAEAGLAVLEAIRADVDSLGASESA